MMACARRRASRTARRELLRIVVTEAEARAGIADRLVLSGGCRFADRPAILRPEFSIPNQSATLSLRFDSSRRR